MDMKTTTQIVEKTIKKTNYRNLSRSEKGKILKELTDTTGLAYHYLTDKIKKLQFQSKAELILSKHRTKNQKYGIEVVFALKHFWKVLKYPCSQILESFLKGEGLNDALKHLAVGTYSSDTIAKLRTSCAKTIDTRLKDTKEKRRLALKYQVKQEEELKKQVRVKLSWELNRLIPGFFQFDLVEHCGGNVFGPFIQTLAFVDSYSGWWAGIPLMRGAKEQVLAAIKEFKKGLPFKLLGLHPDNGRPVLNWLIKKFTDTNNIEYTMARPYEKNDSHLIECKNFTNVRKIIGYSRHDTLREFKIMLELFQAVADLKNYFTPSIKQTSKIRIGGHIERKYKDIKTPYQRLMESEHLTLEQKQELTKRKNNLNIFEVSEKIDQCINLLFKTTHKKYLETENKDIFVEQFSSYFLTTQR